MKIMKSTFVCLAAFMALGAAATEGGIKVELSLPNKLHQGEALPVVVRVKNASSENRSILMPEIQHLGMHTVLFDIIFPDAEESSEISFPDVYIGPLKSMSAYPQVSVIKLPPNGTVAYTFSLFYDFPTVKRRVALFRHTGKYSLRATVFELDESVECRTVTCDVKKHPIQSGHKEFTVVPPESEKDAAAYSEMWKLDCEYLLYAPEYFRKSSLEFVPQLEAFLRRHGSTDLGRRAALPLGMGVSQGFVEDQDGFIKKALEELSQSKLKDASALAADVLQRMASAKEKAERRRQFEKPGGNGNRTKTQ